MKLKFLGSSVWVLGILIGSFSASSCARAGEATINVSRGTALQDFRIEELELRDADLRDALTLIGRPAGLNLAASDEAAKNRVTIRLRNVTVHGAVQAICQTKGLYFNRKPSEEGIDIVTTVKEFQDGLTVFREEKTEVFTLLYQNLTGVATAIRDLYGSRVQLNEEATKTEEDDLGDRLGRFDVIDGRSQGFGGFSGGGSSSGGGAGGGGTQSGGGGGGGSSRSGGSGNGNGNGSLRAQVVRQGEENSRREEFRTLNSEQAITLGKAIEGSKSSIEAEATLQKLRRRESDIFVTVSRKNNIVIVRTSDAAALEDIRALIHNLDVPTSMLLLEVKVLSITLGTGFNSVFDYQFTDGVTSTGGFNLGDILPTPADLFTGGARRLAPLAPGGSGVNSGNMVFQYVNDNFRARLQLLETKNKITTLATPVLLTTNNEVSRLFVGEERPIIRNISSSTVVNNNSTTSTPTTQVEFRPVGTTLLITANINADRTVTLRILQENSSINPGAASIPVVTASGGVTSQAVDVVSTRTISGMVVAKDRLMVAIGGLIEEGVNDSRAQVPILGRIPVLGVPFRRQNSSRDRRELIVMLRPYILSTPAEAQAISKELTGELSLHPNVPEGKGTLNSYTPREVLLPNPPKNREESILKPGVKYEGAR